MRRRRSVVRIASAGTVLTMILFVERMIDSLLLK
jgi:hypothetical protein